MQRQQQFDEQKEGWEEGVVSEDEMNESDVEADTTTKPTIKRERRRAKGLSGEKKDLEAYKRFDESQLVLLPWELREIIEDYSRILQRNQKQKLERKENKSKEKHIQLGGNVFIRNLAGKMTMLEGVRPDMTIWQMKELLDAKTGTLPPLLEAKLCDSQTSVT